jgi:hypothetical protein
MANWILKAVVQKGVSFLPGSHKINYFFQRHVTRGLVLNDDLFTDRLTHCRDHLDSYYKYNGKPGFVCHELGTGWFPIVPLGFWLCGASEIHTLDLSPLIRQENLNKTLSFFKNGQGREDWISFYPNCKKTA